MDIVITAAKDSQQPSEDKKKKKALQEILIPLAPVLSKVMSDKPHMTD